MLSVHALASDVNYRNAVLVLMLACFGNNELDVEKSRLSHDQGPQCLYGAFFFMQYVKYCAIFLCSPGLKLITLLSFIICMQVHTKVHPVCGRATCLCFMFYENSFKLCTCKKCSFKQFMSRNWNSNSYFDF